MGKRAGKREKKSKVIRFYSSPAPMSTTYHRKPEISVQITEEAFELNWSSAVIFLDGIEVNSCVSENKVWYLPFEPLEYGRHTITILIQGERPKAFEESWFFTIGDPKVNYKYYYGIPHAHTSYSDGKGSPMEAFEYAKNKNLDYLFIADHSNYLKKHVGRSRKYHRMEAISSLGEGESIDTWVATEMEAAAFNSENRDFLAVRGFEMTSDHWGHINVINSKDFVEAKKEITEVRDFYHWLGTQKDIVAAVNHPGRSLKYLPYVKEMDGIICLMEVANGAAPRKYVRTEKYYFEALDQGWHLGVLNGQDNHAYNWGDSDNLTVILSKDLTIPSFMDALRNRRTYSTETRSLFMKVKADRHWMGSIIEKSFGERIQFEIFIEDYRTPIEKVQLITNRAQIFDEKTYSAAKEVCWNPSFEVNNSQSWFVVRVIQAGGKWGISSPIFIAHKK